MRHLPRGKDAGYRGVVGGQHPRDAGVGCANYRAANKGSPDAWERESSLVATIVSPKDYAKCHMGPDHSQIEIYNEWKHSIVFRARINEMNLESKSWIAGKDYSAAPTCATCHMSAAKNLPVTLDVGKRINWTLRPIISTMLENWEAKRKDMKQVCVACHGPAFIDGFYKQFDNAVILYNDKFARPAQAVMKELKAAGKITPTPFDDKIEWTFFELWHHEGRRARHGASMQAPITPSGTGSTKWPSTSTSSSCPRRRR